MANEEKERSGRLFNMFLPNREGPRDLNYSWIDDDGDHEGYDLTPELEVALCSFMTFN